MLAVYRLAARLGLPLVALYLRLRARRGKEEAARLGERLGRSDLARPQGTLVWFHGASVGEALSVLPLVAALRAARPGLEVLLTTGTVTSAALVKVRAPNVIHQYVPVDCPAAIGRFLDHWRPDVGVWIESELWPNLVTEAARRGVRLALLNARMSARSYRRWRRFPRLAGRLLGNFRLVLAQSAEARERFRALGAKDVDTLGNLKDGAAPLPVDTQELARLKGLLGARPIWLAASTHPGEEALIVAAHRRIAADHWGMLTVLAPRHPRRGDEIATLCAEHALKTARRSRGEVPHRTTDVWLIDTMGELGLFYRLAGIVFVGGSLVAHGGHNLIEPGHFGCAILSGPHVENFPEIAARFARAGGLVTVTTDTLAETVSALMADRARRQALGDGAHRAAAMEAGVIGRAATALLALIDRADG